MASVRIEKSRSALLGSALLLCLLVQLVMVHGKTWIVGDEGGWQLDPDIEKWPVGKHFQVGDVLVFNYNASAELPVAEVDYEGYQDCKRSENSPVYSSGHDHVTLKKIPSYFVCISMDLCGYGMRIAAEA